MVQILVGLVLLNRLYNNSGYLTRGAAWRVKGAAYRHARLIWFYLQAALLAPDYVCGARHWSVADVELSIVLADALAGLTDRPPVTLGGQSTTYAVAGGEAVDEEDRPSTDFARVSPGYIEAFRIPMLRGRSFSEADREGGALVAVVNETFAMRAWPGESPIGRRVQLGSLDDAELEVVGVARNAKYRTLTESPRAMVYVPFQQWPAGSMVLVARVGRAGPGVAGSLREIVRDIDAAMPTPPDGCTSF